jgi:hypothetical protein
MASSASLTRAAPKMEATAAMGRRRAQVEHLGDEPRLHRRRQGRKVSLAVLDPPRFEGFVVSVVIDVAEIGKLGGDAQR